jgi:hypothetical protein
LAGFKSPLANRFPLLYFSLDVAAGDSIHEEGLFSWCAGGQSNTQNARTVEVFDLEMLRQPSHVLFVVIVIPLAFALFRE